MYDKKKNSNNFIVENFSNFCYYLLFIIYYLLFVIIYHLFIIYYLLINTLYYYLLLSSNIYIIQFII